MNCRKQGGFSDGKAAIDTGRKTVITPQNPDGPFNGCRVDETLAGKSFTALIFWFFCIKTKEQNSHHPCIKTKE